MHACNAATSSLNSCASRIVLAAIQTSQNAVLFSKGLKSTLLYFFSHVDTLSYKAQPEHLCEILQALPCMCIFFKTSYSSNTNI